MPRFLHFTVSKKQNDSHDVIIVGKMEQESDPPPPPPNKKVFKGKRVRRRSLSRVAKKHSNNQKKRKTQQSLTKHDPADFAATHTEAFSNETHPLASTVFKRTSKKEYVDMLSS